MPLNLSVPEMTELKPRISVIGVGGAGGNAVNNMIDSALEGVEFLVANTDAQALGLSKAEKRIQLGVSTTQGLGAGSLPDVGRAAAEESLDELLEHVGNAHMLFVTAGMGGGTGTGAAPVIAKAAKERDILTVGVVTKPFHFEGARRMKIASAGIEALQEHVDTLLIIPNQNLFSIANERTTFHEAFALADQVLHSGVRGITDLMVMPGLINLDFNDVRTVMSEMGKAMMGTGEAEGDKRAIQAAEAAISNPLLDEVSMKGARGVLINITGSMDMTLFEVDEAANRIRAEVDPDANIIVGSTFNQDLEGKVRVSVVATGIDTAVRENRPPEVKTQTPAARPWRDPVSADAPPQAAADPAPQPVLAQDAGAQHAAAQSVPVQTVSVKRAADASNLAAKAPGRSRPAAPKQPPQQPPVRGATAPVSAPASAIDGANPVGDVHERIKKMLTETNAQSMPPSTLGQTSPAPAAKSPVRRPAARPQPADAGKAARNPFREAQSLGKHSIEVAVDMLKSIGAPPKRETPPARPPESAKPSSMMRGDLFDEDDEAELEIPSFLRKKKAG
ncbi:MAG: cell division protein FtsZ [Pseudomonadota bacterium]